MKEHFVHRRLARLQLSTLVARLIPPVSRQRSMDAAHPALRLAAGVVAAVAIAGCVPRRRALAGRGVRPDPSSPQAICQDCTSSSGGGTTTLPSCGMAHGEQHQARPARRTGRRPRAGLRRLPQRPAVCDASASCYASCRSQGAITTCGGYGSCRRYDVYRGYPGDRAEHGLRQRERDRRRGRLHVLRLGALPEDRHVPVLDRRQHVRSADRVGVELPRTVAGDGRVVTTAVEFFDSRRAGFP